MAKRLSDKQKKEILAEFHVGKSQQHLAKKYECSPATVNKLCKGLVPKNVEKVNTLSRIETEIAEQSEQEVNAIRSEVNERTKHIHFFNSVAVKNVKESMAVGCDNQQDFKHRADTILKGRETVLGKAAEPQSQTTVNILTMSTSELEKIARGN